MPTTFGAVDLELNARETEVAGQVRLPSRNQFANAWLVLRLPEPKTLTAVEIDGKPWREFDHQTGIVRLPRKSHAVIRIKAELTAATHSAPAALPERRSP